MKFKFENVPEIEKEVWYWYNVQRTNPKALIPAIKKELKSFKKKSILP